MRASITLLLAASALGLAATAAADEGMWLPSQTPEIAKQLKAEFGAVEGVDGLLDDVLRRANR